MHPKIQNGKSPLGHPARTAGLEGLTDADRRGMLGNRMSVRSEVSGEVSCLRGSVSSARLARWRASAGQRGVRADGRDLAARPPAPRLPAAPPPAPPPA